VEFTEGQQCRLEPNKNKTKTNNRTRTPQREEEKESFLPHNTTMSKKILVAVDGSQNAEEAFQWAVQYSTPKDTLVVFHGEQVRQTNSPNNYPLHPLMPCHFLGGP
jgi:hypothetical protein